MPSLKEQPLSDPTENTDSLHSTLKELADVKYALDVSSIVAITNRSGNISYVNDKFCEISKYARAELIGQNHRIVNSKFHPKEFFRGLWNTILKGQVWQGEIRNRAKDGQYYWVHSTIVPFLAKNGKPYQFVVIHNEITKRKEMEEALSSLPQRILAAQESERERIALDIHDDLGQSLATLKMLFQANFSDNQSLSQKSFRETIEYLDSIINKTRHIASALRPSTLDVLGLQSSLKTLFADFRKNKDLKLRVRMNALSGIVFKGDVINFYRVIQEALTNIIKHANARHVGIDFSRQGDRLVMKIKDDGGGFSYEDHRRDSADDLGLGLSTMQERASLLGGQFQLQSSPGKGTVITLAVPVTYRGADRKNLSSAGDQDVSRVSLEILTQREQDILRLIAAGLANKNIASRLKISIRTVEVHRSHLTAKLGIKTTAGLVKYALSHKIV